MKRVSLRSPLFPYTTLFRSVLRDRLEREYDLDLISTAPSVIYEVTMEDGTETTVTNPSEYPTGKIKEVRERSEEHTSELQSRGHLVCRLLLEKKNHNLNNSR